jgi:hypothetical protein
MKEPNKHIKSFNEHINEERSTPVETNYSGMVSSTLSNLYTQVLAIAQQLANEKAADGTPDATGEIQEVDISRALNLIFHSDWKNNIKQQCIAQVQMNAAERAKKQDDLSNKKNHKALANMGDNGFNNLEVDKSQVRFSDDYSGNGPGSNQ